MKFIIQPYVGALPISFGLEPPVVQNIFSDEPKTSINSLGEYVEFYGAVNVIYCADKRKVVEIGFAPKLVDLEFDGIQLFGSDGNANPLSILYSIDPNPVETYGFILFNKIGVSVTGFHDGNDSQKAVTVYSAGRWDEDLEDAKPFFWNV